MTVDGALKLSRLVLATGLVTALMMAGSTLAPEPATAASPRACRVRNVTHGGSYRTLAAAIRRARNRDKLTVQGTCTGASKIVTKRLTIVGVRNRRSGVPRLRSNGRRPVLSIAGDPSRVTLKNLTIVGRSNVVLGFSGGGIHNQQTLSLVNVKVKGFRTSQSGGGIFNLVGIVHLKGSTAVVHNTAHGGAGIMNEAGTIVLWNQSWVGANTANAGGGIESDGDSAKVIMYGSSAIRGNSATFNGGGIDLGYGSLTMYGRSSVSGNAVGQYGGGIIASGSVALNGNSSVHHNSAERGGGIYSQGDVAMHDDSTIHDNTATVQGGGLDHDYGSLAGVVCDPPNANVYDNEPDDCFLD